MFDFKNSPCTCGYTGHSDSGMLHLCAQSPPTYPTIYTQKDSCTCTHTYTLRCHILRHIYSVHMHTHGHAQTPMETPPPYTHTPFRNVLGPEAPPLLVVVVLGDASVKHPPAPLVDEVTEGDKGDLVERYLHQKVDVLLCQGKGAHCQIYTFLRPHPSNSAVMRL